MFRCGQPDQLGSRFIISHQCKLPGISISSGYFSEIPLQFLPVASLFHCLIASQQYHLFVRRVIQCGSPWSFFTDLEYFFCHGICRFCIHTIRCHLCHGSRTAYYQTYVVHCPQPEHTAKYHQYRQRDPEDHTPQYFFVHRFHIRFGRLPFAALWGCVLTWFHSIPRLWLFGCPPHPALRATFPPRGEGKFNNFACPLLREGKFNNFACPLLREGKFKSPVSIVLRGGWGLGWHRDSSLHPPPRRH